MDKKYEKKSPVGQIIIQGLYKKNITQACLAQKCGMTRSQINRIINGKCFPRVQSLNSISNALDVPLSDLVNALLKLR